MTRAVRELLRRIWLSSTIAILLSLVPASAAAASNAVWKYTLLPDSQLVDDCFCGRPTISVPMRGTFELRLLDENPLFANYAVTNIAFEASYGALVYKVSGGGVFQFGGEVALYQEMFLTTTVDNGFTNEICSFTNDSSTVDRLWPMLHLNLTQTNGSFIQFYRLQILAAPFHEIWFSTANSFHAGIWQTPTNYVSAGDLISSAGRVVKRNHELTAQLGIMPSVPDIGLDAVDVLPGGEVAWSAEEDIWSETLGQLHHGDLLSNRGRVIRSFADFGGVFGPEPPVADQGLDAVQVLASGETYFSVEQDFFSEKLGRKIRRGDLLSTKGQIIRTNEELVARFHPANPTNDYGLDAIYVWPSGEVWFSVETGFYGEHFEPYNAGDLLSDQGYVVIRNLDLVREFAPIEDLADFGLDALFVVTDATPPSPAPQFVQFQIQPASGNMMLQWRGDGRVFQLERATNVIGPYVPLSSPMPDLSFEDTGVLGQSPRTFYRLRQW